MEIHELVALQMVKERVADAVQAAEQTRALRIGRERRPPVRVRTGTLLVRLGYWLMGQHAAPAQSPIELQREGC